QPQHELRGHSGPIDTVSIGRDFVRTAGVYPGRPANLISSWDASDGNLLSTRPCQTNGSTGPKAVAFVHGGSDFLTLDTSSLLVMRDFTSCESKGSAILV